MAERRFPILDEGERPRDIPPSVPWSLVAPHAEQALRNHGQTLERLAERGGLSTRELACVIQDRRPRPFPSMDEAVAVVRAALREGE